MLLGEILFKSKAKLALLPQLIQFVELQACTVIDMRLLYLPQFRKRFNASSSSEIFEVLMKAMYMILHLFLLLEISYLQLYKTLKKCSGLNNVIFIIVLLYK